MKFNFKPPASRCLLFNFLDELATSKSLKVLVVRGWRHILNLRHQICKLLICIYNLTPESWQRGFDWCKKFRDKELIYSAFFEKSFRSNRTKGEQREYKRSRICKE